MSARWMWTIAMTAVIGGLWLWLVFTLWMDSR